MSDGSTIDVAIAFGAAGLDVDDGALRLRVPTDATRGDARIAGRVHRPGVIRDALLAIGDVLASDLRHRAGDRADYLAYLIAKGKGVSKQVWDAQKEFLALTYSEAARAEEPLAPVLTVSDDAVRLELLSRDESTYALLTMRRGAFVDGATLAAGTTHLDVTAELLRAIGRIRTYRATTIETSTADAAPRGRRVPLRWLRAFGQMQAATLLPADTFELAPVDLYNVLLALRLRKARKPPRALRYELIPGEAPRIVLEPWDLVLGGHGAPFAGPRPVVVRTWGRNRLGVLTRVLPHVRSVRVHVLGAGLPALYVADLGDVTLTIALSGWTDAGWAGISTFDLLASEAGGASDLGAQVRAQLPATIDELTTRLGRPRPEVRAAVLGELSQLRAGHDVATGVVFARPLLATPLPADALRFRDAREAAAHRLLAEPGQVELVRVHELPEGRSIEGQVDDRKAHRRFHASFTLDREGRTAAATCTCPTFRRSGLREGPCEHMIAVRVRYVREQARLEAARGTDEGRKLIRAETRTLSRRTTAGTETYRLSLDGRHVTARYGVVEPLRMQRLRFDSDDDARAAYFTRLEQLGDRGYLDGGAGD